MTYKVVPFTASIASDANASAAAAQLETLIQSFTSEGWDYVRLERVDTFVAGTAGCFGFGATPSRSISIAMAVFRK
ncbi:MAG: hypothetical protein QOJ45_423 [Verrucomicrobiota bacterium]|jgi:hypothetical protein